MAEVEHPRAGKIKQLAPAIAYDGEKMKISRPLIVASVALLGASEHKISNPVDLLILYCCSYNPAAGRYSVSVLRVLSIAAMFAVAGLVTMLVLLTRKPKSPAAA